MLHTQRCNSDSTIAVAAIVVASIAAALIVVASIFVAIIVVGVLDFPVLINYDVMSWRTECRSRTEVWGRRAPGVIDVWGTATIDSAGARGILRI